MGKGGKAPLMVTEAATGHVSPLSGAIASVFYNCEGSGQYPDFSSLSTKYDLLVFSSTGSIIRYVLRQSTGEVSGIDLSVLGAVSSGLSQESDARSVVEPFQKCDICYKRNRRDLGGGRGNGGSPKPFQKGMRKGTSIYPTDCGSDTKVKHIAEENHHMYISELELHMHSAYVPLWYKPEIYFQVIMDESIIAKNDIDTGGELEIERVPTRTIEARSK